MIYKTLVVIGIFVFTWLTFGFVAWDFNPATWHQDTRFAFCALWIPSSVMALAVVSDK